MLILLAKIILILSLVGIVVILLKRISQDIPAKDFFEKTAWFCKETKGHLKAFWGLSSRLFRRLRIDEMPCWLKSKLFLIKSQTLKLRRNLLTPPRPQKKQYFQKLLQSLESVKKEKGKDVSLKMEEPKASEVPVRAKENETRKREILLKQEKALIQVITRNPKEIRLYKRLGLLYLELGQLTDAKDCFTQALKLGSQDPEVREALSKLEQRETAEIAQR